MATIVISTTREPMVIASNQQDMLAYIESNTSDPDQQEKLMTCATQYKRKTRRYCLPVTLNLDRKNDEPFYLLNICEIDKTMARYINEYLERLK